MVAHTLNPEAKAGRYLEFKASVGHLDLGQPKLYGENLCQN